MVKTNLSRFLARASLNYPTSNTHLYVFWLIQTWVELMILLDSNILQIGEAFRSDVNKKKHKESLHHRTLSALGLGYSGSNLNPGVIAAIELGIGCLFIWICATILNYSKWRRNYFNSDGHSNLSNISDTIIFTLMYFYDAFCLLPIWLTIKPLGCFNSGSSYENKSLSAADVLDYSKVAEGIVDKEKEGGMKTSNISYASFGNKVECQSFTHYYLICFPILLVLLNVFNIFIHYSLLYKWPNPLSPCGRKNSRGLTRLTGFVFVMIVKAVLVNIGGIRAGTVVTVYWSTVGVVACADFVHAVLVPGYLSRMIRVIDVVKCAFVAMVVLLMGILESSAVPSLSCILIAILLVLVVLKVSLNIHNKRVESLLSNKHSHSLSDANLLQVIVDLIMITSATRSNPNVEGNVLFSKNQLLQKLIAAEEIKVQATTTQPFKLVASSEVELLSKGGAASVREIEFSTNMKEPHSSDQGSDFGQLQSRKSLRMLSVRGLDNVILLQSGELRLDNTNSRKISNENIEKVSFQQMQPSEPPPPQIALSQRSSKRSIRLPPRKNIKSSSSSQIAVRRITQKDTIELDSYTKEYLGTEASTLLEIDTAMQRKMMPGLRQVKSSSWKDLVPYLGLYVIICCNFTQKIPLACCYIREAQEKLKQNVLIEKASKSKYRWSVFGIDLSLEVMLEIIRLFAKENSDKPLDLNEININILKSDKQRLEPKARGRYFMLLSALNWIEDTKKLIFDIISEKKLFVKNILEQGVNFTQVMKSSKRFTTLIEEATNKLKLIIEVTQSNYTPPLIILGNFHDLILQNQYKGRKIIKEVAGKKFLGDCNLVLKSQQGKIGEVCVITMGLERNIFHQIKSATSNTASLLGFNSKELVNERLEKLIPKPLGEKHAVLANPRTYSGNLLMRSRITNVNVLNRDNYIVSFNLSVVLNPRINTGLCAAGFLIASRQSQEDFQIIVNEKGMIVEVEAEASSYFEKESSIDEYSKDLGEILELLNDLSYSVLNNGGLTREGLLHSPKNLVLYYEYLKMRLGKVFAIKSIKGLVYDMNIKLTVSYFHKVGLFCNILKLSVNHNSKRKTLASHDSHGEEEKKLKVTVDSLNSLPDITAEELKLFDLISFVQEDLQLKLDKSMIPVNESGLQQIAYQGSPESCRYGEMGLDSKPTQAPSVARVRRRKNMTGATGMNHMLMSANDDDSLVDIDPQKNALPQVDNQLDAATGVREEKFKLYYKKFVLWEYRKSSFHGSKGLASLFFTCVICLIFQILVGYSKYVIIFQANSETSAKLSMHDSCAWQIWSYTYFPDILSLEELINRGKLPENYNYLTPTISFPQELLDYKLLFKSSALAFLQKAQMTMSEIKFPSMIESDARDYFSENFRCRTKVVTKDQTTLEDNIISLDLNDMLSYMQPHIDKYASNLTSQISPNHEFRAQILDFLTYNHLNDAFALVLNKCKGVYNYIDSVSSLPRTSIIVVQSCTILFIVILLIGSISLLFYWKHNMDLFYTKLFRITKRDMTHYSDDLEIQSMYFNELLNDEWTSYMCNGIILNRQDFAPNKGHYTIGTPGSYYSRSTNFNLHRTATLNFASGEHSPVANKNNEHGYNTDHRINITKNSNFFYGLTYSIICLLLACIPTILLQVYEYSVNYPDSVVIKNLVAMSRLNADLWNAHAIVKTSLNQMMFSNDQSLYLNKKPSEVYREYSRYIKKDLMQRLTEMRELDLGGFSTPYREFTDKYNFCVGLKERGYIPDCGVGPTAHLSQNIILVMKGIMSLLDETFTLASEYIARKDSNVTLLFTEAKFHHYVASTYADRVLADIYYLLANPLHTAITAAGLTPSSLPVSTSQSLTKSLSSSGRAQLYLVLTLLLSSAGIIILWFKVVKRIGRIFKAYHYTCLLVPWRFLLRNPLLSHHFNE